MKIVKFKTSYGYVSFDTEETKRLCKKEDLQKLFGNSKYNFKEVVKCADCSTKKAEYALCHKCMQMVINNVRILAFKQMLEIVETEDNRHLRGKLIGKIKKEIKRLKIRKNIDKPVISICKGCLEPFYRNNKHKFYCSSDCRIDHLSPTAGEGD